MAAIAGLVRFDGGDVDRSSIEGMLERMAHRGPDGRGLWVDGPAGLGQCHLRVTPEVLQERCPPVHGSGDLVLVAEARLDDREALIEALGADRPPATPADAPPADATLILAAYRHWGNDCVAHLIGDFAFAIWDAARRELYCARDPMGVRSLFFQRTRERFAFATEIKALLGLDGQPRELNEERVADYLIHAFPVTTETFYRQIQRLLPGHFASVRPGEFRMQRYWRIDTQREIRLRSDGEYEEAFRSLFDTAVGCRLRSDGPVGATLSGGLDSSAIACTARRHVASAPLHCFSAIFPSLPARDLARIDERAFVASVLKDGDVVAHSIHADRLGPLDDLLRVLRDLDEPTIPFNLYLHRGLYEAARCAGVRVLLDGVDGDTTVSHGYERLPELLSRLRWASLWREARAAAKRSGAASTTALIKELAIEPLLPPGWRGRLPGRGDGSPSPLDIVDAGFAARWRLRERLREREREARPRFRSARLAHAAALESPLLARLLELADKASAPYHVEVRYPFFDRRLVEFCVALPAQQKLRDGWTRSIMRRALDGILPEEIRWRTTKGDLSPNFHRGLRGPGREALERLLLREHSPAVERFLDRAALAEVHERYRSRPTHADAMTLFLAATLVAWTTSSELA